MGGGKFHQFDPHGEWAGLGVETKLDTLLQDIGELSRRVTELLARVTQTHSDALDQTGRMMAISGALADLEARLNYQPPPPPPPPVEPPPVPPPHIGVAKKDGVFVVTGSGFKPGATVSIRVADTAGNQILPAARVSADASGAFTVSVTVNCLGGLAIYFSATDSRPDKTQIGTGVLWSNTVTTTC